MSRLAEPLTRDQIQRFENAVAAFREHGFEPTYRHLANSAAIFSQPECLQASAENPARTWCGRAACFMDFGATSWRRRIAIRNFKPVMSLHSRITLLKWVPAGETVGYGCTFEASRKTLVATIPIGYDDGYMRALSNRGHAIIRGVYATVIGRISMDLTLIDVTNVPGVELDDEVILMGHEGNLSVTAEEIARTAGTLSYEVTCGIGARVPRVYSPVLK